jgi:MFS family permease
MLGRVEIVHHLFVMAVALCIGAFLIGVIADAGRRRGIGPETVLIAATSIFIAAELALVGRVRLPSVGLWGLVASMGAATVLSYSLLADLFPREAAGRANAALNFLHIGAAFAIQTAIGLVINVWSRTPQGGYPPRAYDAAFSMLILLQLAALLWFLIPHAMTSTLRTRLWSASRLRDHV